MAQNQQGNQSLGLDYVGKGFNFLDSKGFNPTADKFNTLASETTKQTNLSDDKEFIISEWSKVLVHSQTDSTFETTHSVHEAEKAYSASLSIEGSYGAYSGSLEASFSEDVKTASVTNITRVSRKLAGYEVSIDSALFKSKLTPEFKNALASNDAKTLFSNYGTHYIASALYGGSINAVYSEKIVSNTVDVNFETKVRARYSAIAEVSATGSFGTTSKTYDQSDNIKEHFVVIGGDFNRQQSVAQENPRLSDVTAWADSVATNPTFACTNSLEEIWKLADTPKQRDFLEKEFYKLLAIQSLKQPQLFKLVGPYQSNLVSMSLNVPDGYKIVSGGAKVDWDGPGFLLTSSYPNNNKQWFASAKAHKYPNNGKLTISVLAIFDPEDNITVKIFKDKGTLSSSPIEAIDVKDDFHLVGGGANIYSEGPGNLLISSYPAQKGNGTGLWEAQGKAHIFPSSATVTSYAIGLKTDLVKITTKVFEPAVSQISESPSVEASPETNYTLIGGGAKIVLFNPGILLTASLTLKGKSWFASGKDHGESCVTNISVYAIGMKVEDQ